MRKINDPDVNVDKFVRETTLYQYIIRCQCGEIWEWTNRRPRSTPFIANMAAEEGWTLDDEGRPRCTRCFRKIKNSQRPKDPDNLGVNQRDLLRALREHGSWGWNTLNGWVYDTPSNTKKILDTLVRRGLVEENDGTYTPSA